MRFGLSPSGKYFAQLASAGTLLYETSQFSQHEGFLPLSSECLFSASISKPGSRMNTIFNTFVPILSAEDKKAGKQVMNTMIGYGSTLNSANNLSLQLQVGSTEYPMRPVTGYGEAYYRLLRSLGIVASQSHSLAITREDFNSTSFVLATDFGEGFNCYVKRSERSGHRHKM